MGWDVLSRTRLVGTPDRAPGLEHTDMFEKCLQECEGDVRLRLQSLPSLDILSQDVVGEMWT